MLVGSVNPVCAGLQRETGIEEDVAPQLKRHADFDAQSAIFPDWERHAARQAPAPQPALQQR